VFFFLTLYLQQVLGYSALRGGLAFLPLAAGVIIIAPTASRLVGPAPTLIAGPLVSPRGWSTSAACPRTAPTSPTSCPAWS
jgi:hypothetical protein